jgi:hypothetical protein
MSVKLILQHFREYGLKKTLKKMYWFGDVKVGTLVGQDRFGNQ